MLARLMVVAYAGTIDEVLIDQSGAIVQKGQPLFKITPDEKVVEEDPSLKAARIRKNTDEYLAKL